MSQLVSAAPPSGGIKWEDLKGKLLVIEPLSFEQNIQTAYGSADAVKANVFALTGPKESEDYIETLVFPKLLASQLRSQIGNMVVGRLSQGVAKASQSPPWVLEQATPDDLAKAEAWVREHSAPAIASATPPWET